MIWPDIFILCVTQWFNCWQGWKPEILEDLLTICAVWSMFNSGAGVTVHWISRWWSDIYYVSVEVWTAGIGVSIHQHMIQFWPAEPVHWGFSRGCGLYHSKNIHRGVRAELRQLRLRPSLTQVSCPYSADKLPQLWCYFKQSPCCPSCPAGLRTKADGAPLLWEFTPPTNLRLNLSRKWINDEVKRASPKHWQVCLCVLSSKESICSLFFLFQWSSGSQISLLSTLLARALALLLGVSWSLNTSN